MTRYAPRSQSRPVMLEKEVVARRLLLQGLTLQQISTQLRCSTHFVRCVRTTLDAERSIHE